MADRFRVYGCSKLVFHDELIDDARVFILATSEDQAVEDDPASLQQQAQAARVACVHRAHLQLLNFIISRPFLLALDLGLVGDHKMKVFEVFRCV